jgi:hypothetical protein
MKEVGDSSTSSSSLIFDTNKTINSIMPKLKANDFRPNFSRNYKQSGARLESLVQSKRSKSLKINVAAPQSWLRSKYLPSNFKQENHT